MLLVLKSITLYLYLMYVSGNFFLDCLIRMHHLLLKYLYTLKNNKILGRILYDIEVAIVI